MRLTPKNTGSFAEASNASYGRSVQKKLARQRAVAEAAVAQAIDPTRERRKQRRLQRKLASVAAGQLTPNKLVEPYALRKPAPMPKPHVAKSDFIKPLSRADLMRGKAY